MKILYSMNTIKINYKGINKQFNQKLTIRRIKLKIKDRNKTIYLKNLIINIIIIIKNNKMKQVMIHMNHIEITTFIIIIITIIKIITIIMNKSFLKMIIQIMNMIIQLTQIIQNINMNIIIIENIIINIINKKIKIFYQTKVAII